MIVVPAPLIKGKTAGLVNPPISNVGNAAGQDVVRIGERIVNTAFELLAKAHESNEVAGGLFEFAFCNDLQLKLLKLTLELLAQVVDELQAEQTGGGGITAPSVQKAGEVFG